MKRFVFALLLWSTAVFAQSVTIPANSMTFTGTVSGSVTTVTTVGPTLTDSAGNKWAITSGAQVSINSETLTQTANVIEIAIVNGSLWQLNKAGSWYEATAVTGTSPSQTVTFSGGTTTSPIPSGSTTTVTVTGPSTSLTIPVTGLTNGLPAGITWTPAVGSTPAVFTVAGNVSAANLVLTAGPALPACTSGVYVYQLVAGTANTLTPICLPLTINP